MRGSAVDSDQWSHQLLVTYSTAVSRSPTTWWYSKYHLIAARPFVLSLAYSDLPFSLVKFPHYVEPIMNIYMFYITSSFLAMLSQKVLKWELSFLAVTHSLIHSSVLPDTCTWRKVSTASKHSSTESIAFETNQKNALRCTVFRRH